MATDPLFEEKKALAAGATAAEARKVWETAAAVAREERRVADAAASAAADAASKAHAQQERIARSQQEAAFAAQRAADIAAAELEESRQHRALLEQEAQRANEISAQLAAESKKHQKAMLQVEHDRNRRAKEAACPLYLVAKKVHALRVREMCFEQAESLTALTSKLLDAKQLVVPEYSAWTTEGPLDANELSCPPIAAGGNSLALAQKERDDVAARVLKQKSPSGKQKAVLAAAEASLAAALSQRSQRDALVKSLSAHWHKQLIDFADRLGKAASAGQEALADAQSQFDQWHERATALRAPNLSPRASHVLAQEGLGAFHQVAGWKTDSDEASERFVDYELCVLMSSSSSAGSAQVDYPGLGPLPRSQEEIAALVAALASNGPVHQGLAVESALDARDEVVGALNTVPLLQALVKRWLDEEASAKFLGWAVDIGIHTPPQANENCQHKLAALVRPFAESAHEADFLWNFLGEAGGLNADRSRNSNHKESGIYGICEAKTVGEWLDLSPLPEPKPKHKYLNTVHVLDPNADLSELVDKFETGEYSMLGHDGRVIDLTKRTEPTAKDILIGLATLIIFILLVVSLFRRIYLWFV